jgi:hypothetical protein
VICGTTSVIAALPTSTIETDFQMPFVKVGMPFSKVLLYGAHCGSSGAESKLPARV